MSWRDVPKASKQAFAALVGSPKPRRLRDYRGIFETALLEEGKSEAQALAEVKGWMEWWDAAEARGREEQETREKERRQKEQERWQKEQERQQKAQERQEHRLALLRSGRPVPAELHQGRCVMCGRRLTDPASVAWGIGPDCIERAGRGGMIPNAVLLAYRADVRRTSKDGSPAPKRR